MWIQLDSNVRKKMAASLPGDFPSVGKLSPYFARQANLNWHRFAIHGTSGRSWECEPWVKHGSPVNPESRRTSTRSDLWNSYWNKPGKSGSNGLNLATKCQFMISFWQLMWLEITINYD
jgi:hypothetical protein